MTKYLVLLLSCVLLAPVFAQRTAEDEAKIKNAEAITKRSDTLLLEAESLAMERCDTARVDVSLPTYDKWTFSETTVDTIVSIEWRGACVDTKRDGDGVLNWTERTTERTKMPDAMMTSETIIAYRSEGRFVKGQRIGLWCMTKKSSFGGEMKMEGVPPSPPTAPFERQDSGCSVFAGHAKPLTGNYRKQPDGRWQEFVHDSPMDTFLAAGALEAQSAKVLVDTAAGKTGLKVALIVQSQSLDDLVRGSKIVLAPSTVPISLKDKRVAIVLSSQTVRELERFKRERLALIEASAGLIGEAAAARAKFILASDPDRLLINILKVVKKYAKDAQPADDLSGLQKGGFDYALVVDWKSMTRFDLLGKYDSFPRPSLEASKKGNVDRPKYAFAGDSLGGFLISRDLKAVKHASASSFLKTRYPQQWDNSKADDQDYLSSLADTFAINWGNGADDIGHSIRGLDFILKGEK